MNPNVRLCEQAAIVGTIDPQVIVDTEIFSDYVDMNEWGQVTAICLTGNLDVNGGVTFKVYAYSDQSGSDSTEIMGCTALVAHAADNDNKQLVIGVRNEDVLAKARAGGKDLRYVRAGLVSAAGQTGPMGAVVLGSQRRHGDEWGNDLASVVEIEIDRT